MPYLSRNLILSCLLYMTLKSPHMWKRSRCMCRTCLEGPSHMRTLRLRRVKQVEVGALQDCERGPDRIEMFLAPWVQGEMDPVVRRTVYDSNTGAKLLDEEVTGNTVIRQPFGSAHDTTTILVYRGSGPTSRSTVVPDPMCKGAAIASNSQHGSCSATRDLRPDRDSCLLRLEQSGGGHRRGGRQGEADSIQAQPPSTRRDLHDREEVQIQVARQSTGQETQGQRSSTEVRPRQSEKKRPPSESDEPIDVESEAESPKECLKPLEYFEANKVAFLEDMIAKEKKTIRESDNEQDVEYARRRMRASRPDRRDRGGPKAFHHLQGAGQAEEGWRGKLEGQGPVFQGQGRDIGRGDRGGQSPTKGRKSSSNKPHLEAEPQTKAKTKKTSKSAPKQLTDVATNFPSLSNKFSDDLAVNMATSFQSMLFTWKWKEITWMLRIRKATRDEFGSRARWKRNPRWLMALLAKQIAFMWGHLGSLRQTMNNPKHLHLMGGEVPVEDPGEEEPRRRGRREARSCARASARP